MTFTNSSVGYHRRGDENTGMATKKKIGRFRVSIWRKKKVFRAKSDFHMEREVEIVRACIQYSSFNQVTRTWNNQSIWCSPQELRDLANLLDRFNEDLPGKELEPASQNRSLCTIVKHTGSGTRTSDDSSYRAGYQRCRPSSNYLHPPRYVTRTLRP